jgi:DNA modification methylase
MKITEIKPNPNNPRVIRDEKFEKLKKSIQDFPEMLRLRPMVVDNDHVILGGNMRYQALLDLGYKELQDDWVVKAEDLTEDQKREFIIKDNIGFGEWDYDQLANEWDIEKLHDWGMDLWDVDKHLDPVEEDDYEPPTDVQTEIKPGDLVEIGKHRLLCGDSTLSEDVDKLMKGSMADMVFTDPPWNVNYGAVEKGNKQGYKPRTIENDNMSTDEFKQFMSDAFSMMSMASKEGAPTYVVMSAQEWGNMMLTIKENGYHWSSTIIWAKDALVLSRKDYHTQYEPIWYGWKEGAARLQDVQDRKQSDVWEVDRPRVSELHPTTKPIKLVARAIENSSKYDAVILDLFGGSGSTMVAAHQLGRTCYMMEMDPKYVQVIAERMKELDKSLKIKLNGKAWKL